MGSTGNCKSTFFWIPFLNPLLLFFLEYVFVHTSEEGPVWIDKVIYPTDFIDHTIK